MVFTLICFNSKGSWHLVQSSDRRGMKVWISGVIPEASVVAGVELLVTSVQPICLAVDSQSVLVPVSLCSPDALSRVVDLCCGMGGFSSTASRLGLSVQAGVDQNGIWQSLFGTLHPGATFVCGDLADPSVVQKLMQQDLFHAVVCAGIACQPHSVLGDRRGMEDPRSDSLPKSLLIGWLLQSAALILECTPEILRDAAAQEIIRQFAVDTGFRVSQAIVKLGNVWCTRRDRWIAVLTAPVVSPCELLDLPMDSDIRVVADLIPEFQLWHQYDQTQLVLNLYELSKYYQFAAGGMEAIWLKPHEKLPTLLHSAGNQLYTCACGCRAALSDKRLSQRGLIGTLLKLGTSQVHMHVCMEHARYLHPIEMWALMGGMPNISMGHNLRLAMSGVGQAVAPIMGLWIFAQVKRCLDLTLELPNPCEPLKVLQAYMHEVVACCRTMWPLPVAPTAVESTDVDDPIEDASMTCVVTRPLTDEPDVAIGLSPGTTGSQLLQAEANLGLLVDDCLVRIDGLAVDPNLPIPGGSLVAIVPASWTPDQLRAQPHLPCCLDTDEFLHQALAPGSLPTTQPVVTTEQLADLRYPDMFRLARQDLLGMQGPVWGDDEIMHGLLQVAVLTESDQRVHVWDPLLVTGLVQHDQPATWKELVSVLGPVATVISAVLLGNHWIPLVWRVDMVGVVLHSLSVSSDFESALEGLSRVIGLVRGGAQGVWKAHSVGFLPAGHCGALCLSFVRHLLWDITWLLIHLTCRSLLTKFVLSLLMGFLIHVNDHVWLALVSRCPTVWLFSWLSMVSLKLTPHSVLLLSWRHLVKKGFQGLLMQQIPGGNLNGWPTNCGRLTCWSSLLSSRCRFPNVRLTGQLARRSTSRPKEKERVSLLVPVLTHPCCGLNMEFFKVIMVKDWANFHCPKSGPMLLGLRWCLQLVSSLTSKHPILCQLVHWLSLWLMLRVLCLPRFRSLLSVSRWSVLQMVSLCLLMAFFSNLVQSGFRGLQFSKDVKFFPSQPAWWRLWCSVMKQVRIGRQLLLTHCSTSLRRSHQCKRVGTQNVQDVKRGINCLKPLWTLRCLNFGESSGYVWTFLTARQKKLTCSRPTSACLNTFSSRCHTFQGIVGFTLSRKPWMAENPHRTFRWCGSQSWMPPSCCCSARPSPMWWAWQD